MWSIPFICLSVLFYLVSAGPDWTIIDKIGPSFLFGALATSVALFKLHTCSARLWLSISILVTNVGGAYVTYLAGRQWLSIVVLVYILLGIQTVFARKALHIDQRVVTNGYGSFFIDLFTLPMLILSIIMAVGVLTQSGHVIIGSIMLLWSLYVSWYIMLPLIEKSFIKKPYSQRALWMGPLSGLGIWLGLAVLYWYMSQPHIAILEFYAGNALFVLLMNIYVAIRIALYIMNKIK